MTDMFDFRRLFIGPEKKSIIAQISSSVAFTHQYFILLALSAVIATLGLIINNGAVVIGAMILSPLINPIMGLTLSTVIGDGKLFKISLSLLVVSIFITVAVAALISLFTPLKEVRSEILLRVNPTIFDLVIALAAGTAASLIVSWPKYSLHTAGVAVAASVLPPICITGIGLAFDLKRVAVGSFVLFMTNLVSIMFVGIIVFALVGFYRSKNENQKRSFEMGLLFSFLMVLVLGFQLIFSLRQIITKNEAETKTKNVLEEEFKKISNDIRIDSTTLAYVYGSDPLQIDAEIKVPSGSNINLTQKNNIVDRLENALQRDVNLELQVVPILRVVSAEQEVVEEDRIAALAEKVVAEGVRQISERLQVESVSTLKNEAAGGYAIKVVLRVPQDFEFIPEYKENLFFLLINRLTVPVDLSIQLVHYTQL